MTPKEKAMELFDKYCYALRTEEQIEAYWTNVIHAKECTLIAVDEILKSPTPKQGKYWEAVKQEIEKL